MVYVALQVLLCRVTSTQTQANNNRDENKIKNIFDFFSETSNQQYKTVKFSELSNFQYDPSRVDELPRIGSNNLPTGRLSALADSSRLQHSNLIDAVKIGVQRNPEISQSIASLAAQNSNIDVAKAQYYPQLTAGISTGDLTTGERGRQLLTLSLIHI